jgi:hypothetical protein
MVNRRRKTNKKKKGGFSSFFSKKRPLDNKLNAFYDAQNINCENMVTEDTVTIPNNARMDSGQPIEFSDILHTQYTKCCSNNFFSGKKNPNFCKEIKDKKLIQQSVKKANNDKGLTEYDDNDDNDEKEVLTKMIAPSISPKPNDNDYSKVEINKVNTDCDAYSITDINNLNNKDTLDNINTRCCVNSKKWWVGKYLGRKNPSQKCKEVRKRIKNLDTTEEPEEKSKEEKEKVKEIEEIPTPSLNPEQKHNATYEDKLVTDSRILDFRKNLQQLSIPDSFKENKDYNLMLTAGDGKSWFGDYENGILNLVSMPHYGWNIFCCVYDGDMKGTLDDNIKYLEQKPELNVLLCLIDLNNMEECQKFGTLFEGQINKINSHDSRWYLPTDICYKILKPDGVCYLMNISWNDKILMKQELFNFNTPKWNCNEERSEENGMYNIYKCTKKMSGGKRNKRKTNKRKTNKRKTNKRKTNK